jgi:hypothetical protein
MKSPDCSTPWRNAEARDEAVHPVPMITGSDTNCNNPLPPVRSTRRREQITKEIEDRISEARRKNTFLTRSCF